MGFKDGDLAELFGEIGTKINVELGGLVVATVQGRIKKEAVAGSPFDAVAELLVPFLTCATSELAGLTKNHIFIDNGTRYKFARDSQPSNAGFTRVALTVAK